MKYIQCPQILHLEPDEKSLFLAGGISNCPDWQSALAAQLEDTAWVLLNPRRADFDAANTRLAEEQIVWEHQHLRLATALAFWFPSQTLCPITLYELGAWSMTDKPLFVGTHPDYKRRLDVQVQTRLVRPDVTVVDSLEALAERLRRQI
jgi:hypothetical protein